MSVDSLVKSRKETAEKASCFECEWTSNGGSQGARKAAYDHTFYFGHKTTCEVVKRFNYEEDLE